ncbi:MAG: hypothetical protein WD360_06605 [Nitriliruptoraceae bacterium]
MSEYVAPRNTTPPPGLGHLRGIPRRVTDTQRANLEKLLTNTNSWVLRFAWEEYLETGDLHALIPIAKLTTDQRAAGIAWLTQQQHALYWALFNERVAPNGWIETQPLMQQLRSQ